MISVEGVVARARPSEAAGKLTREKTKVFVSYSRKDGNAVGRIVEALEAHDNFQVFRDMEDILPTEEWRGRLESLIAQSDAVIFCLSPSSADSEVCAWEVKTAEALNKRIAPLVIQDVGGRGPGSISKLNYLFLTERDDFEDGIHKLVSALDTDIGWIREHTRLEELSRRWMTTGQSKGRLLRDADIEVAEAWVRQRPHTAPNVSDTTLNFIAASRQERSTQARRAWSIRALIGVLAVGVVGIAALAYAGWFDSSFLEIHARRLMDRYMPTPLTPAAEHALKAGDQFKECASCPEMIVLPSGDFLMGSSESATEQPAHKVSITQPFAVSKFEVTFRQWDACVAHGGCTYSPPDRGWGRGQHPVINVSWGDSQEFIAWLSKQTGGHYRLLTESEWEYAARAGSTTQYSYGDDEAVLSDYAWYYENAFIDGVGSGAHVVGLKKPNRFGLHDVHGNVWEWTQDCYQDNLDLARPDGSAVTSGDCEIRTVRGGAYDNLASALRSSNRNSDLAANRFDFIGFRVARTLSP
jgi:formylglycine-generating enzyme required for sulfatase activity